MQFVSTAFESGARIPKDCSKEGRDRSPELRWEGLPEGTRALALICDDPDAPREKPWVHWVIYDLPADLPGLPEGVSPQAAPANGRGAKQGKNDFGDLGYGGPMPPPGHGVHHYHFKLYALKQPVGLPEGATKEELLGAMEGKILAEAELIGTYERR